MKSRHFRLCSILLVIALLLNMLPMGVFAEKLRENATNTELQVDSEIRVVDEIQENRTEFSKEFLLSSGLHMAVVYPEAVHFETENGWEEIDNTLITKADGTLTNTAGVWNVSFPETLNESVIIEKDGYTLSFSMAGELNSTGAMRMTASVDDTVRPMQIEEVKASKVQQKERGVSSLKEAAEYPETVPEKLQSGVAYSEVYKDTQVTYDLESNKVKESVILEAYKDTLQGYRYTLNVDEMIPMLGSDGQITLYDKTKENIVLVMPAPYLVDNAGEYNNDIQVLLEGSGSEYTMTYLLPTQWLAAEDRSWPVILDPIVTPTLTTTNIRDITVFENESYWSANTTKLTQSWGMLQVGYYSTEGKTRTYLKYNDLPELTSSDVVVSASVHLYNADVENTGQLQTNVHKVNGAWESDSITWANKPGYDTNIQDYALVNDEAGWYSWIITDIVRDWYATGNTGMLFKASDGVEAAAATKYKQFFSSDYSDYNGSKPVLYIQFRNNNGLESYWDYTSSDAGRAGTGYINNFTGNLVWTREDIGFGGNRMPVDIQHIYNANDAGTNAYAMGGGWKTNYHQTLKVWSQDSSYYVWDDSDGTDHYFKRQSDGTYKDEDGLEMTVTVSGNTKIITDKQGNKSYFDSYGRLYKLENNQATKSSITITYQIIELCHIDSITDGAGRVYKFNYLGGQVHTIQYMGTGTTALATVWFWYDGWDLVTIKETDGRYSNYRYNDKGLITTVIDIDDYILNYSYNTTANGLPSRVSCVEESNNGKNGGKLNIEYAHNQTTFTDHNDNVEIHQFNDFGNTVSVQDDEGHAQYSEYTRNTDQETTKTNQLTLSSRLQNTVGNQYNNSNFEHSISSWTPNWSAITASKTAEASYLGYYSLKVVNTASDTPALLGPAISIAPGETKTFSAYLNTADVNCCIGFHDYATGTGNIYSPEVEKNQGWKRAEVSYTNETSNVMYFNICLFTRTPGTVYMDCVQVERTNSASRFNLVCNGDFSDGFYGWMDNSGAIVSLNESATKTLNGNVHRMVGVPTYQRRLSQTLYMKGTAGDSFVVAGWAKGDSAPLTGGREFAIWAILHYTDGETETFAAQFNPDTDSKQSWQYASKAAVAQKDYSAITVKLVYDYNVNTVYFDGIQLYKEEFGNSYTYDSKGNVISVKDLQAQTTTYEYDTGSNLTKIIQNNKAKMTYTYDSFHNVKTATTEEGLAYSFAYDTYGNNTSVSISSGGNTISASATYSSDGNRLVSTTDALGKVTAYGYNGNTNVLEWVQYPEDTEDTRTEYTYDGMYRIATAACSTDTGSNLSASYTYVGDRLTKIETGSTTYNFDYGDFYLRTGVGIGDRTLATYSYTNDRNHYLSALDYGNEDSVNYTYDGKGRVTGQSYEDGDTVSYTYDNSGALATVTDSATGITTTYYYDLTDRLMKYVEKGSGYNHSVDYEYDALNNLTKLTETINGTVHTTTYAYDDDNRITSVTEGQAGRHYTYDAFGRGSQQVTKHNGSDVLTQSATFQNPTDGKTAAQVAAYTLDAAGYDVAYTYTYDDNGNITGISDGVNTTSYVYDSANQLIRENNQAGGFTHVWEYDNAGNILSRKEYSYTTGELGTPTDTVTYTYGDSNWGDLLTAYDGNTVTYDEIGNPLTDGTWTYTWEHGRQLASMTDGTTTWSHTYNVDGLRTQRTDGTTAYSYVYNGGSLRQLTRGSDTLYISYDASGVPMSLSCNGTSYYYATNLQGDITAILDTTGTAVVSYTYDAWGNILATEGTMKDTLGTLNPLRYRGYVYDQETGLYYLQSRYYNPEIGRFVNADGFVTTGQGFIGNNMFAYCGNSPVGRCDMEGMRYCAATSVSKESSYDRFISSQFQRIVSLEKCGIVIDITNKLNTFMEENAKVLRTYADTHNLKDTMTYFIRNVTDGGSLDIKLQEEWAFDSTKTYIYSGMILRYDDPGNINFGFVGAEIYPRTFLCFGAGLNQISKYGFAFGDIFSFFDDPRDNYMIKYGYMIHRRRTS